ncbi:hypothetical protein GCM10009628_38900 [Paeniglutamicibacter kerguelensis]
MLSDGEVAFRLPVNLGRSALRVTRAVVPPAVVLGALSLMGVADAPLLNAAGLVTALLALMLWATRAIMRKGKPRQRQERPDRKHRGQAVAVAGNTGSRSLVQDLALLAALHSRGQLTDEEFASIKAKLLEG